MRTGLLQSQQQTCAAVPRKLPGTILPLQALRARRGEAAPTATDQTIGCAYHDLSQANRGRTRE